MDFINTVIMARASARSFTGEAIPKDTLMRIVRAGMAAPSAMNARPWAFLLVTDRLKLDELASELPYAKMLEKAGAAVVVCGQALERRLRRRQREHSPRRRGPRPRRGVDRGLSRPPAPRDRAAPPPHPGRGRPPERDPDRRDRGQGSRAQGQVGPEGPAPR
jgi:nitroreductase